MTEFGPVAEVYDELMSSVPYRMWVGYYLLLLSTLNAKPKKILDVCCGTGKMARMLSKEGFQVDGFDLSAPMIEIAQQRAIDEQVDGAFVVADAAHFNLDQQYESAYSFFDSLNYITDPEKLQLAFHRVSQHIQPGGTFIFDMNTAYAFEQKMFDQKKLSPRAKVRYDWKGNWNPETRLIHVNMTFWAGDREFKEVHVQRAYDLWEVREMLNRAGFDTVDVYHAYTLDPPRAKSDRIHFACVRGKP